MVKTESIRSTSFLFIYYQGFIFTCYCFICKPSVFDYDQQLCESIFLHGLLTDFVIFLLLSLMMVWAIQPRPLHSFSLLWIFILLVSVTRQLHSNEVFFWWRRELLLHVFNSVVIKRRESFMADFHHSNRFECSSHLPLFKICSAGFWRWVFGHQYFSRAVLPFYIQKALSDKR